MESGKSEATHTESFGKGILIGDLDSTKKYCQEHKSEQLKMAVNLLGDLEAEKPSMGERMILRRYFEDSFADIMSSTTSGEWIKDHIAFVCVIIKQVIHEDFREMAEMFIIISLVNVPNIVKEYISIRLR